MEEFTERHHAFIAAAFYDELTKTFGERGKAAFVMATQRYAEQRGARMAQRAIRDGKPLDFVTYREYGEWVNTKTTIDAGESNQSVPLTSSPDCEYKVTRCPWAAQFKDMDMRQGGVCYCTHLDKSIVRGFNPYLVFEVPQSMHDHDYCIQIMRGANFKEDQKFERDIKNQKGFDYHCGHSYKTFAQVTEAIFASAGRKISSRVLDRFAEEYGRDMADGLMSFWNVDFNFI
ncbi:MAG: L-2-amino-thiazoline-4-carboxylic acid hydrolase [Clostridiaceae bacterium]|nr:L-2-amino-thiazoline-4-carboxylic acid hydrolase [Clostridiaceae bacterium]